MSPDIGYFQERQIFFELRDRQFFLSNWEVIYPQLYLSYKPNFAPPNDAPNEIPFNHSK
jgi:hypothetical protein